MKKKKQYKFNLNDYVLVQLTDMGREALRQQHEELYSNIEKITGKKIESEFRSYRPPKEDADGWSRWQAWDLIESLGHHLGLGCYPPPFELTIKIEL